MIHNSFEALKAEIESKLNQNMVSDSLCLLKNFVEQIISNKMLYGLLMDVAGIDELCLKVGQKILPTISYSYNKQPQKTSPILYIASQFYLSGGHTAVVIDFIKAQINNKHIILLTDIFLADEQQAIKNRFHDLPVELIFAHTNSTYQEKLLWLHEKWLQIGPQKVFLFNHPQDPIVIAAAQPYMPGELFFYHHVDYTLTLGAQLTHAKHIDMNPLLFSYCKNLRKSNNFYCPLTCEQLNKKHTTKKFMSMGIVNTATSANFTKFSIPYLFSYVELLPEIMKITKGNHLHIGTLPTTVLALIKKKLDIAHIFTDRFTYIPNTNSVATTLVEYNTDLYITSFPVGGGRTAIEAMSSGIPILCHLNYRSVFLSEKQYLYPEAFTWKDPTSLTKVLQQLTPELLTKHSLSAKKHYEDNYTHTILEKTIENNFKNIKPTINVEPNCIIPDPMQLFLDINYEMTTNKTNTRNILSKIYNLLKQFVPWRIRKIDQLI